MNAAPLEEWLERAEEDFRLAQVALRQRKYPAYHGACFHAQQRVEKYLKAFLTRHVIAFSKTHDLIELQRLGLPVDATLSLITNSLKILFPYAVDVRYPGTPANEQDARDAVAAMKQVRQFIRARLGLESK